MAAREAQIRRAAQATQKAAQRQQRPAAHDSSARSSSRRSLSGDALALSHRVFLPGVERAQDVALAAWPRDRDRRRPSPVRRGRTSAAAPTGTGNSIRSCTRRAVRRSRRCGPRRAPMPSRLDVRPPSRSAHVFRARAGRAYAMQNGRGPLLVVIRCPIAVRVDVAQRRRRGRPSAGERRLRWATMSFEPPAARVMEQIGGSGRRPPRDAVERLVDVR